MESDRFLQLINETQSWPQSEEQWLSLARFILEVFSVPCVFLFSEDFKTLYASQFLNSSAVSCSCRQRLGSDLRSHRTYFDDEKRVIFSCSSQELGGGEDLLHCAAQWVLLPVKKRRGDSHESPLTLVMGVKEPLSVDQGLLLVSIGLWLESLKHELQLKNEKFQRNQFLSVATHELKTPLTAIYGMLQLRVRTLQVKSKDPVEVPIHEEDLRFFRTLIRQVERLRDLIDDLLSVSRIENGKLTIQLNHTDVSKLVSECLQSRLNILAKEASVILKSTLEEQIWAEVDPMRLEEVITNLVMNAIRFSPEGGMISLNLFQENQFLKVTVKDQGPSIRDEDRERVFQPFEQAQKTSRFGGLGLGLYISRQIARLHGGDVFLQEGSLGQGNKFEARFPLSGGKLV